MDSRPVTSNQHGVHVNLEKTVIKHSQNRFKKPIRSHNEHAFSEILHRWADFGGKLIMDSGCGTGLSSIQLAKSNPDCFVVGIDQSESRLSKTDVLEEARRLPNLILTRSNCEDIWRLAQRSGWRIHKHYLLYPNPWPKKHHLLRRWHAHPAFPTLLDISDCIEIRSNWRIYVEEFALAARILGIELAQVEEYRPQDQYISLFEKKYHLSGHTLYRAAFDCNYRMPEPLRYHGANGSGTDRG